MTKINKEAIEKLHEYVEERRQEERERNEQIYRELEETVSWEKYNQLKQENKELKNELQKLYNLMQPRELTKEEKKEILREFLDE